jgi:hypothetical protein
VRIRFCNVPKVETFILCRTAKYLGKVARSNERTYPKKILGAWMNQPKENGWVQLSCNDTFAKAISAIFPQKNLSSQCLFRDWIPEAKDEPMWLTKIDQ